MKIDVVLGAEMTALLSELVGAMQGAMTSLPPLPAPADLVSLTPDGDFFGGDVKVVVAPGAALVAYVAELKARLTAFGTVSKES